MLSVKKSERVPYAFFNCAFISLNAFVGAQTTQARSLLGKIM